MFQRIKHKTFKKEVKEGKMYKCAPKLGRNLSICLKLFYGV